MKFINDASIPPLLAGWLSIDDYDYNPDAKTISATTLLKPLRQVVLSKRYLASPEARINLTSLIPSRIGTAIHDAIEKAWTNNLSQILANLEVPMALRPHYLINPDPEQLTNKSKAIYLEQRLERMIGDWKVTGKFDAVLYKQLNDIKYTSVYSYFSESKAEDYAIQGSIYRWLNPELITSNTIKINFVFNNWDKKSAYKPDYPKSPCAEKEYELYEEEDTGLWIQERIELFEKYFDAPESEIPECSRDDLWVEGSVWKYYKNPESRKRSTANFDSQDDALARWTADGQIGVVVEIMDEPRACRYCEGAALCKQKDKYVEQGILKL